MATRRTQPRRPHLASWDGGGYGRACRVCGKTELDIVANNLAECVGFPETFLLPAAPEAMRRELRLGPQRIPLELREDPDG